MIFSLPPAPTQYSTQAWNQILDSIRKAFIPVISKDEAAARILLRSPNGTTYEVTVDDTGTLSAVANDGKSRNL